MSLINDALKKAQKQRTHEPSAAVLAGAPPAPGPSPRVAKRSPPMPAQTLVIIGMMCLMLLVAIVAGAWFIFGNSPSPAAIAAPAPTSIKTTAVVSAPVPDPVPAPEPAAPVSASSPASSPTGNALPPAAAPVPAPVAVAAVGVAPALPSATPVLGPSTPVATTLLGGPTPAVTPEETPLHVDLPLAVRPVVPPNPKISAVVDQMKVSGIRASASDPKVLMNDRVFRIKDLVDRGTGLRLLEITPGHLVFIDEEGATYVKNF